MSIAASVSMSIPTSVSVPDPLSLHCVGPSKHATDRPVCKRKTTWWIKNVGVFCHNCYENYFGSHPEIDVDDIRRLSERDGDFYNGNGR